MIGERRNSVAGRRASGEKREKVFSLFSPKAREGGSCSTKLASSNYYLMHILSIFSAAARAARYQEIRR